MSIPIRRADSGRRDVLRTAAGEASLFIDLADGNVHDITMTADTTIQYVENAVDGWACEVVVILRQDATGGWTITWPGNIAWPTGEDGAVASAASSVTIFSLLSIDGGFSWFGKRIAGY